MGSMGSKESDNVFMEAGIRSSSGQKEKILEAANQSFKLLGVDKARSSARSSCELRLNVPLD